jgi:hypothetical protein
MKGTTHETRHLPDPDMGNATAALIRAAERAREIARQTGTAVVYIKDGKLVIEIPKPSSVHRKRTK